MEAILQWPQLPTIAKFMLRQGMECQSLLGTRTMRRGTQLQSLQWNPHMTGRYQSRRIIVTQYHYIRISHCQKQDNSILELHNRIQTMEHTVVMKAHPRLAPMLVKGIRTIIVWLAKPRSMTAVQLTLELLEVCPAKIRSNRI